MSRRSQRLTILTLIVLNLALGWALGWRAAARWVEAKARAELAEPRRGLDIACTGLRVGGFPFALRLACDDVAVTDSERGADALLAGGAGSYRAWRPLTPRLTLVSPVKIRAGPGEAPISASWREAGADIGLWWNGPRSTRFDATAFIATAQEAQIKAEALTTSIAPGKEDGSSRVTADAKGFSVTAEGSTTLPVTLSLRSNLAAPPRDILLGEYDPLVSGFSLSDVALRVSDGTFRIAADGELSVDADGVANGELRVRIAGFEALPAFIASLPEKARRPASAAIGGFMAIGGPAKIDGKAAREVTLDVEDGKARIGFISLGHVELF